MKRCSKCILPENFPEIHFDSKGVCNFCLNKTIIMEGGYHLSAEERERLSRELEAILRMRNKKGPWDILVGMSGGKDSAILAMKLKEDYGLRVFGYTFDAGFNSNTAKENLKNILKKLHIAHIHYTLPRSLFLKILRYYLLNLKKPLLETVCRTCGALYGNVAKKLAIQMNIPLIAYGWTRGQGPAKPHYVVPKVRFLDEIQMPDDLFWQKLDKEEREYLWDLCAYQLTPVIPKGFRRIIAKYFWGKFPDRFVRTFPITLTPYKIWDYIPQNNLKDVVKMGLIENGKSHPIDTNCNLIPLFCKVDSKLNGFNPFITDFADHVREGNYDREEWEKIFDEMELPDWRREQTETILKEIGMKWHDLEKITPLQV